MNNIESNGYAQPNERTSWRHPLSVDEGVAEVMGGQNYPNEDPENQFARAI
jgi:hypothetical protein